jgi:hypothetical protein
MRLRCQLGHKRDWCSYVHKAHKSYSTTAYYVSYESYGIKLSFTVSILVVCDGEEYAVYDKRFFLPGAWKPSSAKKSSSPADRTDQCWTVGDQKPKVRSRKNRLQCIALISDLSATGILLPPLLPQKEVVSHEK